MIMWDRRGEDLVLLLSPDGVRFLREQWSWLRELVRWQIGTCTTDPLARITGLPVPVEPIDGRLAYVVDYWCGPEDSGPNPAGSNQAGSNQAGSNQAGSGVAGSSPTGSTETGAPGPLRAVWEAWVLDDLDHALTRVLSTLPRHGGVVQLPGRNRQAIAEWGWMLETLYVVLDVSGRVNNRPLHPGRKLPVRPTAADTENYRRSLRWLEMVLDTLAQAERTSPARAAD